jgi:hypothetical protein
VHEIGEMLKRDGTDTYFVTQTSEFLVLWTALEKFQNFYVRVYLCCYVSMLRK